jgi:hypothetical protein
MMNAILFSLICFGSSLVMAAENVSKKHCGKVSNIGLSNVNGTIMYNFGMRYSMVTGTNSFAWLEIDNPKEKEVLDFVKYAKANNLTICLDYPLNVEKSGYGIEIQ